MSDVTCPYCGYAQEINHDDGYGYEEDEEYEQECANCEKTFIFTTSISFSYDVECQKGDHEMEQSLPGMYCCKNCEYVDWKR